MVEQWEYQTSTPTLILPLERGCCRFSDSTTTAYSLRVQGGGHFVDFDRIADMNITYLTLTLTSSSPSGSLTCTAQAMHGSKL